jgi:hypothetical protein
LAASFKNLKASLKSVCAGLSIGNQQQQSFNVELPAPAYRLLISG